MDGPMPDPARLRWEIGPQLVKVEVPSCYGCPALRRVTEADGKGEHIAAYCSAKPDAISRDPLGTLITPYWRIDRAPPSWCPGA